MPLILLAPKRNHVHWAGKTANPVARVLKFDAYRMRILLIFVDQHQGPLAIRTVQCICRYQNMTGGVANVAGDGEHTMLPIARLNPFQVNHLA